MHEYFNASSKEMTVKKGEILLDYQSPNRRLFLVLSGTLTGNIPDEQGNYYELFRATEGMFVGVYSFFSGKFITNSRLMAVEDSRLAYIEREDLKFDDPETGLKALEESVQVIVNELAQRQQLAHEVTLENRNTMKRLMQADKMATLGQMAAGLAHELNNAIMVLDRNTEYIAGQLTDLINARLDKYAEIFNDGKSHGNQLSTEEIRQKVASIEKELKVSRPLTKKLAKTGYEVDYFKKFNEEELTNIYQYWELGAAFYDMRLAATHAMHVVRSVKQLGANRLERQYGIQINDTLREAMGILSSQLRGVSVTKQMAELPAIYGSHGEFVQIWINLIKNACEAMASAHTPNPTLNISTFVLKKNIKVEITDNGPGIPEEIIAKIFQPNFTTKIGGLSFGLGLGLSIVERLVDSYDGKIKLATKPGNTTFTILIPINHGND